MISIYETWNILYFWNKMEVESIPILENLSIIYEVMPYYGYTHRIFLILSKLSKNTRSILKHNYKIFWRIMLDYSLKKKVSIEVLLKMSFPFDLFKFNIEYDSFLINIQNLVLFANTVSLE